MDVINMEVKIKQGNEMLDATIEMVDGVMVVSPQVDKFDPKDGDVLSCVYGGKYQGTFVLEEASECREAIFHFALNSDGKFIKGDGLYYMGYVDDARPATEEEKKKLFDKLAEEGYEWDAEKKELVKIKWKPVDHEKVYVAGFTFYGAHPFCPFEDKAYSDSMQWRAVYERGWYFKTIEECQSFCDKLNQAINSVKP